jgi:hypothetical protein
VPLGFRSKYAMVREFLQTRQPPDSQLLSVRYSAEVEEFVRQTSAVRQHRADASGLGLDEDQGGQGVVEG